MFRCLYALLAFSLLAGPAGAADTWKAGVAKVKITPRELMWMSGYAARDHVAEGTLHELWAKALVLEDPHGHRAAMVTIDLVGLDRDYSLAVRKSLADKFGLNAEQVALCCSHTHSGPIVSTNLISMYLLTEPQREQVRSYAAQLHTDLAKVVGEAIAGLAPAELQWAVGQTDIAVNRRNNKEADVPRLRTEGTLKGPVDHDVPVLAVKRPDGALAAVLFGYACHATVLSGYQWSSDYPGCAQAEFEKAHAGATALFFAGCGGDQNPLPRRQVELAEQYGRKLAEAIDVVLAGPMKNVQGDLAASYEEISLPLDKLPTREDLEREAESSNKYLARRAKLLLEQIAAGRPLSPTYPYPIQLWRLGSELTLVTLGGEVVVDYSLRLKQSLGERTTWIAAYTNDVMAYIPSRRVLTEGGYEGAGAMMYYGLPTTWAPEVEETLVRNVERMAKQAGVGEK